jgi:hypothetical protein
MTNEPKPQTFIIDADRPGSVFATVAVTCSFCGGLWRGPKATYHMEYPDGALGHAKQVFNCGCKARAK